MKSAKTCAVLVAVGVLGMAHAPVFAAASAVDVKAIREAAKSAVCRVTVTNSWGVPVAMASGFLIGDGRFLVTDLGAVAQPDVAGVSFVFADGATATTTQFGLADATLGLVVLRVEGLASPRAGLPLAAALPSPLDGSVTVAAAGWQFGSQLDVVTGRLLKGPAIREVAALTRVDASGGVDTFVRMDGPRLEAPGSPVLDSAGTVVAVAMEVTIHETVAALAIPASSLRAALLGAAPQLKALSELPRPLWPSKMLRVVGAPAAAADCAGGVSGLKSAMTCSACGGQGKVRVMDTSSMYGYSYYSYSPCPTCHGERVAVQKGLMKAVSPLVEGASRTVWAPAVDDRSRVAARAAGQEVVKALSTSGPYFQKAYAAAVAAELGRSDLALPQGVLVHAEVQKRVDGPDGRYLFLAPRDCPTPVLVRVDDLVAPGAKTTAPRKEPAGQTWLILAGLAVSRFKGEGSQGLFVVPLEWAPAAPPQAPPKP
jgi:hypothetical protein